MRIEDRPIETIYVGETRARKQFVNVDRLAASIKSIGLLQPIGVKPDGTLVFGERRLRACKVAGMTKVPCRILHNITDELAYLRAEQAENLEREPLTATEAASLAVRLLPDAQSQAAERAKAGKTPAQFAQGSAGRAIDVVSAVVGVKPRTLEKAIAIVEAAKAEPERFGDLPDKMNAESVDAAHKEAKKRGLKKPKPKPKQRAVTPAKIRVYDDRRQVVPEHLASTFGDPRLAVLMGNLSRWLTTCGAGGWKDSLEQIKTHNGRLQTDVITREILTAIAQVDRVVATLASFKPFAICPQCDGNQGGCASCDTFGWVTKSRYQELTANGGLT